MNESNIQTFDWLNKEFLAKIIQNQYKWKADEFKIDTFDVSLASAKGENYLGTLLRVKIVILKDNESPIEQYYVIKTAAGDGNSSEEIANQFGAYPKEMEMYKNVLPIFHKIWEDVGYNIQFAPKCYAVFKDPVDIIVLEDLKQAGFTMEDRCIGFDMNHTLLVIEKLAQFHATSIIFFEKYGKFHERLYDGYFCEKMYSDECKAYFTKLYSSFKKAVSTWPGFEKVHEKISSWGEDVYMHAVNAAKLTPRDFGCLAHGDVWVNNILFKESKQDRKPKDLRFVDFQITCVSSPSIDLHFLISSSLVEDDRENEFDNIIAHYQECLTKSLKQLHYEGHIPTLREIQLDMLNRSMLGNCIVLEGLTLVLKNRDSTIDLETIGADTEEAEESRRQLFANPVYVRIAQKYLKFLYKRGMLDLL